LARDDEVGHACHGVLVALVASVAVAMGKAGHGRSAHQEVAEDAIFHKLDRPRADALVVDTVMPKETLATVGAARWVVDNVDPLREDPRSDLRGEGLPFAARDHALPLKTVAKGFV